MVKVKTLAFAGLMILANSALAGGGEAAGQEGFNPAFAMTILTWVVFIVLLAVGYKMAWKPIVDGLNTREDSIRDSISKAEEAEKRLSELEKTIASERSAAQSEAKALITEARDTAAVLAKEIEEKAKTEAQATRDNALADIEAATSAALKSLKDESAELAIELAGKLLGENLNDEKNRALTAKLIEKI